MDDLRLSNRMVVYALTHAGLEAISNEGKRA